MGCPSFHQTLRTVVSFKAGGYLADRRQMAGVQVLPVRLGFDAGCQSAGYQFLSRGDLFHVVCINSLFP